MRQSQQQVLLSSRRIFSKLSVLGFGDFAAAVVPGLVAHLVAIILHAANIA